MTTEQFYKWWKCLLIELGINEKEAAAIIGLSQQSINRKAKEGTIRFIEIQNLLEHFGKSLDTK